ncbi:MAG: LTA synthase family protein [Allobaculum sp.]|nr:LTA synthase family protein [Allobaculum sp.]
MLYIFSTETEGSEDTIRLAVEGFFHNYWFILLIGTAAFAYYVYLCIQRSKEKKESKEFFQTKAGHIFSYSIIGVTIAISCLFNIGLQNVRSILKVREYKEDINHVSYLYEDYFVEPDTVKITFPQEKRNLIHIVVESLETSYSTEEYGGNYPEDLIPDLYQIAKSGTDFSIEGTQKLNGAVVTNNCGWTVAGLVGMSAGLPLNLGNDAFDKNFSKDKQFLPHVVTLGDILESNGYKNYFMCGSKAKYAGRSNYYTQHGNYEILDYYEAIEEKVIPEDYKVWWGYEDSKLFSWAKDTLKEISQEDEPFNFTLLTADTHFPKGYLCELCPDEYDSQYKNVIACADHQISDFIEWITQQDFYEDTTILITGDHLSMDGSVKKITGEDYERKAFVAVINGPDYTLKKNRQFTTLDLFPTTLEALGGEIEGHRLGLGTSLYSEALTLLESMGENTLNTEISGNSVYYSEVILSGDDSKPAST